MSFHWSLEKCHGYHLAMGQETVTPSVHIKIAGTMDVHPPKIALSKHSEPPKSAGLSCLLSKLPITWGVYHMFIPPNMNSYKFEALNHPPKKTNVKIDASSSSATALDFHRHSQASKGCRPNFSSLSWMVSTPWCGMCSFTICARPRPTAGLRAPGGSLA